MGLDLAALREKLPPTAEGMFAYGLHNRAPFLLWAELGERRELRCQCEQTLSAVIPPPLHVPRRIAHVELIPEGPHCGVQEVVVTRKDSEKVCLEPTAPWVKLIVTKILSR
ncbi:unnamed protein product [Natator depressus]